MFTMPHTIGDIVPVVPGQPLGVPYQEIMGLYIETGGLLVVTMGAGLTRRINVPDTTFLPVQVTAISTDTTCTGISVFVRGS